MGGWQWKLKRDRALSAIKEITEPVKLPEPVIQPVQKPKNHNPQQLTLF